MTISGSIPLLCRRFFAVKPCPRSLWSANQDGILRHFQGKEAVQSPRCHLASVFGQKLVHVLSLRRNSQCARAYCELVPMWRVNRTERLVMEN